MSSFRSDAQGFLVGELVTGTRDILRSQQQGMNIWRAIRSDVRNISRAVNSQVATVNRMSRPGAVQPRAAGRAVAMPVGRSSGALRVASPGARASIATPVGRDSGGRFVAGQRRDGAGFGSSGSKAPGAAASAGAIKRLSDSIGKLSGSFAAADNMDPTINAMREIKDVVSPLGRGLFSLFGRSAERKKEMWRTRILKALTSRKPGEVSQGRNGAGGFFGGGGGIAGGALGAAGGGLLGGILGKGAGLLKKGGGLLKRIPVLGALLAGGGALASIFGGGDRDEKYKGVGEAGGMLAGGIAGAKGGALLGAFAGPVGIAIGGFLGGVGGALFGEVIGAKVGDWTKQLVDSDVPAQMVQAWNITTTPMGAAWDSFAADAKVGWAAVAAGAKTAWDTMTTGVGDAWKATKNTGNKINEKIKENTGVDIKAGVANAYDKTKTAVVDAAAAVKDNYVSAAKTTYEAVVPNTVKRAINAGAAAAEQAKAGYDERRGTETTAPAPSGAIQRGARAAGSAAGGLGDIIAKHEGGYGSFNRGSAGDSKGATMDFSQMTVAEIMAAQALPKGDKNRLFAVGKYQAIPSTLAGAAKTMGLKGDEKFTPELQERVFSEYLTDKKRPAISGFIKGKHDDLNKAQTAGAQEWASIADPKTGKSYYAGTGNNHAGLSAEKFGGSLTASRAKYQTLIAQGYSEKDAYAMAVSGGAASSSAIPSVGRPATTAAVPSMPSLASANVPSSVPLTLPAMPDTPAPATPLNSGAGAGRGVVHVSLPEKTGQNISDRQIAHVVSGGLGGA